MSGGGKATQQAVEAALKVDGPADVTQSTLEAGVSVIGPAYTTQSTLEAGVNIIGRSHVSQSSLEVMVKLRAVTYTFNEVDNPDAINGISSGDIARVQEIDWVGV